MYLEWILYFNSLAILYIPMTKYAFEFSRQFTCWVVGSNPFWATFQLYLNQPRFEPMTPGSWVNIVFRIFNCSAPRPTIPTRNYYYFHKLFRARVRNGCKFKCGPWLEIEIRMSCLQLGHIISQILHTLPVLCIPKCRVLKVVTVFRPQKLAKQKVPGGIRLYLDSKPIVLSRSMGSICNWFCTVCNSFYFTKSNSKKPSIKTFLLWGDER